MHGGGGAPTEVNDQQWQNQIKLYQPEEGIYIAPRAPTDSWNLWHQAHIDDLFDRLIETYIATRNVNPDRVYLMGYSAGGDGVFQLAPRMADRFAAAAMMAGHPNETKPLGLRNLPFAVLMGADDGAYDRNKKAEQWETALADLAAADPGGYPHEVKIYEGLGHWMERKDAEILPWMASHTRNPWPKRIVWHQDDVTHDRFYWLALDRGDAKPRATITAEADGQTISLTTPDELAAIRLRLRDRLVDLDRPLTVIANGEKVFEGVVPRTRAAIDRSLAERLDPRSAATAELVVRLPAPEPDPAAPSDP
jgi:pimeloyl-ACP methyl ester carboxylesterase